MSGSDSEGSLSTPANLPTDPEIESTLRSIVRDALKKDEDVTINTARGRAEKQLGLHAGFFVEDSQWKAKSRDIVKVAADEPSSPEKPKKTTPKAKAGTKRKSDEAQGRNKRRKKSVEPVVDSSEEEDAAPMKEEAQDSDALELIEVKTRPKSQPKSEEESALSEPPEDESEPAALKQNGKPTTTNALIDDSDLSSVIDDAPGKKRSSLPSAKAKPKPKSETTARSTKPEKAKPDLTPEEEEIKRLQSWLLKCGIRKLWHRDLAHYTTPKEKIKHLKSMLDDVGMSGRFSAEKAKQIKEQRELKAELEAAKSFNDQWGQQGDEGEGNGKEVKQPTRRLKPKGLVDFGDSGDESD